jgi:hypothetical protein
MRAGLLHLFSYNMQGWTRHIQSVKVDLLRSFVTESQRRRAEVLGAFLFKVTRRLWPFHVDGHPLGLFQGQYVDIVKPKASRLFASKHPYREQWSLMNGH